MWRRGGILLPPPCVALVEALDNPNKDPLSNSVENCIPYEKLIISAKNWNNFIVYIREFSDGITYAEMLNSAFYEEKYNLDYPQAFADADDAIVNAVAVFVLMKDPERAEVYVDLIRMWRNGVLEMVVPNYTAFAETLAVLNSHSATDILPQGHSPKSLLKCLILNDAYTLEFKKVIASKRFNQCLRAHLGN